MSEEIDISPSAVVASYGVLAVPSANPSMALLLDVMGLAGQGWVVRLRDPMGSLVWETMLEAVHDE